MNNNLNALFCVAFERANGALVHKTRFGYHIIKLEDSCKRELPKFEDVKNQIKPVVQNKRLQEYVMKLRSKAKIEVK